MRSQDIFSKPTDTHQYLMAFSCHPGHTKRNIAYSQALRICRIFSNMNLAKMRCAQLEQYLIRRGHSKRHTKRGIQEAFAMFLQPISDNTSQSVSPNTVQTSLCTNPRPQNSIEMISSDRRSQCSLYL